MPSCVSTGKEAVLFYTVVSRAEMFNLNVGPFVSFCFLLPVLVWAFGRPEVNGRRSCTQFITLSPKQRKRYSHELVCRPGKNIYGFC